MGQNQPAEPTLENLLALGHLKGIDQDTIRHGLSPFQDRVARQCAAG